MNSDWMQIIKTFLVALLFVFPFRPYAQSTFLQPGAKDYILLDRLEIKMQKDSLLNFSAIRPFSRKWWAEGLQHSLDPKFDSLFSRIDRYNIRRAMLNNMEWIPELPFSPVSRKSILNAFYKDPANMVMVKQKDFFLSINPVFQGQLMRDDAFEGMRYVNSRGVVLRSVVAGKVGVQAYLTENQEKPPAFVRRLNDRFRSVQGAGLYRPFKESGYDFFDARGSIVFNAAKYFDVQFGYDKLFLGNGYRSLFIGDHGAPHLFLNLNLRIWKLNYSSRVMELQPQYTRRSLGEDTLFSKKYASIHYLSFNTPKWLTLGFFEGIVFGRLNQIEFNYLNPVIFLRAAELNVGSPDNSFIGFDAKANLGRKVQVYGQVMLDEFYTKYIREKKGWWGNKWAFQFGLKHPDLFGIRNLDLQIEANWIRPFTYSHFDTVANYTHYNQALAHPLMSNVREGIFVLRYQPAPRWYIQSRSVYWKTGEEAPGENFGNNIFTDSDTRTKNEGIFYGSPKSVDFLNSNFWVAYEIKENLFLEGNLNYRKKEGAASNLFSSIGIRWNMQRREYDY